ncbi:MAG TPA: glycosyltransferase family 39 protein [Candidatus Tectomicrobia bacterium]|nr:glycosyltransferase family 39 protein [Candidatus Tectomicrobia bacterium]
MDSQSVPIPSWQVWAVHGLLFLIFVTITYDHSKAWNNPNEGDQDLDLVLGLKIRHFEALTDGYHHPLLAALVAPFAEKNLVYFAQAKLVNVAIGAVAFWVIVWVGRRTVGPAPTFLALLAILPGLSNKSAEFTAEPLLLLLIPVTFYCLVRGFERPGYWGLAGVSAGLAYLTKGSGLLLPMAYVLTVLRAAPKLVLVPSFLLFPLAFALVASPLLVYNWQVFGSPIFNYNTAHVIWLDYTEEQMIMFDKGPPTMWSYVATHSFEDILRRFLSGLVLVRGAEWVWPFLLIFVFVPKRWLAYFQFCPRKRLMVIVASTLVLTFYLPFGWSAVVQRGIRYLLPIFPVVFLMLADVIVFYGARLARWLWLPARRQRLTSLGMHGCLATLGVVWLVQLSIRDLQAPLAIDFEDQATAELYHLLDTPAFEGKRVLFGPSHEFTGTWLFRHNVAFPIIPPGLPAAEFLSWLERAGIDFILANREMIERRRHTLGDYLTYSPTEGVQALRLEPSWQVTYRGPPPARFVLIRVR